MMMFGRGFALAAAAFSLAAPVAAPIVASSVVPVRPAQPAIKAVPAHRLRADRRRQDRRDRQGRTYGRGDKLARRLRRKVLLGRNGSF
ncbi:hypothetical protein [Sphingomonas sp. Leaf25]|uniref:hypothetical protein n=1 Tax=Sphingomonas sp. Leaf25 TaxID=1735692 RepID=UPI0006FE1819|nr:hypothetical protein [Sphingomonas sp. Leaf25]KQN00557.1 hypothetical protein ASE78_05580 [Sphingomonas sp. Leaf25]